MSDEQAAYIDVKTAAQLLRLSERQVHRYGKQEQLRTTRQGRKTLFHLDDVRDLAVKLDVANRPPPEQRAPLAREQQADIVQLLREERDERRFQQQRYEALLVELAAARQELKQYQVLTDRQQELQQTIAKQEAALAAARLQVERSALVPRWIRRLFGAE